MTFLNHIINDKRWTLWTINTTAAGVDVTVKKSNTRTERLYNICTKH